MITPTFLLAGRASCVIENPQGESVTVKLNKARPTLNPRTGQPWPPTYFVSVRHNNDAWVYVGRLQGQRIVPTRSVTTVGLRPTTLRIAQWALTRVFTQTDVPAGYRLAHTGRCGKCGKMLRDAESLALGLGPVCRGAA